MARTYPGIIFLLALKIASCKRSLPPDGVSRKAKANSSVAASTLISGAQNGKESGKPYFTPGHCNHVFFVRGGDIDGEANSTLGVKQGQKVEIALLDLGERGQPARLAIPNLALKTTQLSKNGESSVLTFIGERPALSRKPAGPHLTARTGTPASRA